MPCRVNRKKASNKKIDFIQGIEQMLTSNQSTKIFVRMKENTTVYAVQLHIDFTTSQGTEQKGDLIDVVIKSM